MSRFKKVLGILAVLMFVAANAGWAQMQTQSLTRMFSFDPHPPSADFPQSVNFNGEMLFPRVVFHETWKSVKDKDFLQTINFTLQAVRGSEVVSEASTTPFNFGKISKGQQVGETKLAGTNLTVTIDEFVKTGSGITDLTLTFKLESTQSQAAPTIERADTKQAPAATTVKTEAPSGEKANVDIAASLKTSAALYFGQKLAEQAAKMPAEKVVARLSLLKKALAVVPMNGLSPDVANFRNGIEKLIGEIENNKGISPAPVTAADKVVSVPETAAPVVTDTPVVPVSKPAEPAKVSAKVAVDPAAKELYLSAKTLLAQDKGPEGREALRKALEIAPDYTDALLLLGDNAYSNRKYSRAKEAFEKIINQDEKNAEALLKYFKSCYYLGEVSEAILRLAAAKNKFPGDQGVKFSTSEAYFQLGDLINAELICNEILAVSPDNYRAKDLMQRIKSHLK